MVTSFLFISTTTTVKIFLLLVVTIIVNQNFAIGYCKQGSHVVLKVLNCEIGFQNLEKVLILAKMSAMY